MNNGSPPSSLITIGAWIIASASALHPWASTGAAFGCFFFLTVSSRLRPLHRMQLLVFSWGIGYAAGLYWNGDDAARQGAMLVSGFAAALGAAVFTGLYRMIDRDGGLPPWLNSLLDRLPFIKKGGPSDGV